MPAPVDADAHDGPSDLRQQLSHWGNDESLSFVGAVGCGITIAMSCAVPSEPGVRKDQTKR